MNTVPDAPKASGFKPYEKTDEPEFGVLKLVVEPAGSNILINGETASPAEMAEGKSLKTGICEIEVFANGYKRVDCVMKIEANTTQSALISLTAEQGGSERAKE